MPSVLLETRLSPELLSLGFRDELSSLVPHLWWEMEGSCLSQVGKLIKAPSETWVGESLYTAHSESTCTFTAMTHSRKYILQNDPMHILYLCVCT